jgi:hypothetical protein
VAVSAVVARGQDRQMRQKARVLNLMSVLVFFLIKLIHFFVTWQWKQEPEQGQTCSHQTRIQPENILVAKLI